jgi:hypothetical protein
LLSLVGNWWNTDACRDPNSNFTLNKDTIEDPKTPVEEYWE